MYYKIKNKIKYTCHMYLYSYLFKERLGVEITNLFVLLYNKLGTVSFLSHKNACHSSDLFKNY